MPERRVKLRPLEYLLPQNLPHLMTEAARLVHKFRSDIHRRRHKPKKIKLSSQQEIDYLETANAISSPFGLRCEFLGDAMATGVVGDNRAYTRAMNLIGPFPGYDVLAKVSTEISNTLPIVKVTYQTAVKDKTPE